MSRRATLLAVLGPEKLGVLAVSGGAAAVLHLPVVFALGGVAYAALVAWDLMGNQEPEAPPPPPPPLPTPESLADPACKEAVSALDAARAALADVSEQAGGDVLAHLAGPLAQVGDLERAAGGLLRRADELHRYLQAQSGDKVRRDLARDREMAAKARDPGTQEAYQKAAAAREDQLRALDELAGARDRALAHVRGIVATLEGLPSRIVQLKAKDAATMDAVGGDVSKDLDRLNSEVRLFEATLAGLSKELSP